MPAIWFYEVVGRGVPALEALVRQLIAITDSNLDHLAEALRQVNVEVAAQMVALDLSTQ